MKKLLFAAPLLLASLFAVKAAEAKQLILPTQVDVSTTITNASLVLSTPTGTGFLNCVSHITVSDSLAGTITFTPAAASPVSFYSVVASSAVPWDSQWGYGVAWCGPPGAQVTIAVSAGNYTISAETFVWKGLTP